MAKFIMTAADAEALGFNRTILVELPEWQFRNVISSWLEATMRNYTETSETKLMLHDTIEELELALPDKDAPEPTGQKPDSANWDVEVATFKAYLTEMLGRAENTVSTEALRARMWSAFLPTAIEFWTLSGVLERIAAVVAEPDENQGDQE